MMKCDMCYDRTSQGLKPMCASVCPSQALFFGTREEIEALRPRSRAIDTFRFGGQVISTRVRMLVPKSFPDPLLAVTAAFEHETAPEPVDPLLANLYEEDACDRP
jgi:Fe-S-cluster-containing dehydrogenase component